MNRPWDTIGRVVVALFMIAMGLAWQWGMFPGVGPDVAIVVGAIWAVGGLIVLWR